nr:hypothetical protein [Chitinophaga polysaccharea]
MKILKNHIEIIAAPSILGLKPNGVELLPEALINAGLEKQLQTNIPVQYLSTLNAMYSKDRDPETGCLNPDTLRQFSIKLGKVIAATAGRKHLLLFWEEIAVSCWELCPGLKPWVPMAWYS